MKSKAHTAGGGNLNYYNATSLDIYVYVLATTGLEENRIEINITFSADTDHSNDTIVNNITNYNGTTVTKSEDENDVDYNKYAIIIIVIMWVAIILLFIGYFCFSSHKTRKVEKPE